MYLLIFNVDLENPSSETLKTTLSLCQSKNAILKIKEQEVVCYTNLKL